MRHEYDTLIRHIADATKLDFYYVERMLESMIKKVVADEFAVLTRKSVNWPTPSDDDTHERPRTTEESTRA